MIHPRAVRVNVVQHLLDHFAKLAALAWNTNLTQPRDLVGIRNLKHAFVAFAIGPVEQPMDNLDQKRFE